MDEQTYKNLIAMFESDGWLHFIKEAQSLLDAYTAGALDSVNTQEELMFLKGRVDQLRSIVGYETFVNLSYENQSDE